MRKTVFVLLASFIVLIAAAAYLMFVSHSLLVRCRGVLMCFEDIVFSALTAVYAGLLMLFAVCIFAAAMYVMIKDG